ncbi:LppU/SCO3897 family protein [Actinokineospora enzanensis]|uniref:LppU/SCO3897 family protein n=1 Tax=Actinokineospora enzanensis TaxID=155975 RepID=UPI000375C415|nr:hypothetical protein [Actinokineospora enzanensis]
MQPDGSADHPLLFELTAAEVGHDIVRVVTVPAGEGRPARQITMRVPAQAVDGTLIRVTMQDGGVVHFRVHHAAPARTRRPWLVVAAVVVVVLASVIVVRTAFSGHDESLPPAASSEPVAPTTTLETTTTTAPTTTEPITTAPITTEPITTAPITTEYAPPIDTVPVDPQDSATVGTCLQQTGTDTDPDMIPAPCARGMFRVKQRFAGTTLDSACRKVRGYTHTFIVTKYYVTTRNGIEISRRPAPAESYVLCLQEL